jgi:hypothetical protein
MAWHQGILQHVSYIMLLAACIWKAMLHCWLQIKQGTLVNLGGNACASTQ